MTEAKDGRVIHRKLTHRIAETLGLAEGVAPAETAGAKNLQECFDCTSLEIVSVQLAVEDEFGLKFATGLGDRGPIDEEWDKCKSLDDVVKLVTEHMT